MGRGAGHLCAPLAGGIAAPCALATPGPPRHPSLPYIARREAAEARRTAAGGAAPRPPITAASAQRPAPGGGGGPPAAAARRAAAPRSAALPRLSLLPCLPSPPFACSLPPSPPLPSSPSIPPVTGERRGGVSLGLYRTAGGPGRRGVRDSPPPPPRPRGHRRDTHHAPAILPPNLLPAAPPRAVRTLDFPSGPAPELVRAVRGGGRLSAARCCRLGSGDTTCASAARRLWGAGALGAPGGAYRHQQAGGGGPRARGTGRLYRALPVAGPPALSEGSHH